MKMLILCCALVVIALASMTWAIFATNNQKITIADNQTPLPADTVAAADFQQNFPYQYDSYLKNTEMDTQESYAATGGKYGGAYADVSHYELEPYLPTLFNGMGFAVEYNEERGHLYTLEDVRAITTERTKAGASCTYCKSADIPALLEEYGADFYTSSFDDMYSQMSNAITCADCHDPVTMELRITRPALVEAFEAQGKDIEEATTQEMRTLVCAQCHVEYYFAKDTKVVTFPWAKGEKVEDVYTYYQEIGFSDFTQADTGASMLKAQHPDYELFLGSTHEVAGVTCADCHMPYTVEGNKKYSSHWWTSPLKTVETSCLQCHSESADALVARVVAIQDSSFEIQDLAANTLVQTVADISAAVDRGVSDEALAEARELYRQAQFYWDWIAAENSRGFHNSQDALNISAKAIDLAHQASAAALAAE